MDSKYRKKTELKGHKNKAFQRKELIQALLPLAKSFMLWGVLVIIVAWDYTNHRWFSMFFVDLTTYLTYGLSRMMFIPTAILGNGTSMITTLIVNYKTVSINNYPMIIELECSAYHAYLAIFALIVFSKWTIRQKLLAGSAILALLAVINSLRIILLGIIGHQYPNLFDFMHDYIWNILMVIIIWALWEFTNQKMTKKTYEAIPSK